MTVSKTIKPDERKHEIDLGGGSVGKLVLRLTVPAVIAQLINLLYNMVDRMYVGGIADAGTDSLAGLGVVFPITMMISAFSSLVGMGGAPLAGIRLGEGKRGEAQKVFNNGFAMLAVFGAVLTAVVLLFGGNLVRAFGAPDSCYPYAKDYLDIYGIGTVFVMITLGLNPFITTQGRSLTSMLTVSIGAVLNIALDPLFIFGFGMGVKGAALATVLAQAASAAWVVCIFFGKRSMFRFHLKDMIPRARLLGQITMLGLSPFIMQITESAIQIVFNVNLNWYSGGNSAYTAALTVMLSAISMIMLPLNGLGAGVQPLVSFNYGKGDASRVKKAVRYVTLIALVWSVTVWLVSLIFPQVYGYLFSATDEVMAIIRRYTPVFMMGTVMFFAQMSWQAVFVALGQAKISICLAVLRKVALLIPLCFLLPLAMGVQGVFFSEGIADLTAGVITTLTFLLAFPRILKKRSAAVAAAIQQAEESTLNF